MRYVEAGGTRMSAIGLGAWQFGAQGWDYGDEYIKVEAKKIVDAALANGVDLIDTAEAYGQGKSEQVLAPIIGERRKDVFIATKLFPNGVPDEEEVVRRGKASAERLGVETIDLYQQHWPSPDVPVERVMAGMKRLRDEGVVTHVGVSNFGSDLWAEAESLLGAPVLTNQVLYSLVARGVEKKVVPYAQANDRIVIAYSPLGQGFLSGRYDGTNTPEDLRKGNPLFSAAAAEKGKALLAALGEIADGHGATAAQVALAWVIRNPNVVAIPGASSAEQMVRNAEAADLELTDDEDARLREASQHFIDDAGDLLRRR